MKDIKVSKKKKVDLQIELLSNIQLELFWIVELLKITALKGEGKISRKEFVEWLNNLNDKNNGDNNHSDNS